MKYYIGTKAVKAEKMSLYDFQEEKFGKVDKSVENQLGYKVEYKGGYVSWSPKKPFEEAYHEVDVDGTVEKGTQEHTFIGKDTIKFNAPHNYTIKGMNIDADIILGHIHFQEGPVKEHGVNGIFHEDLINIVIDRLEHFQKSKFSCRENAVAITKLEEALMWLRKRTDDRKMRGVQGTSKV
jgi:hypothetical protein